MTERTSFLRKVAYGVAIAVLAVVMMWLSAPPTSTREGGKLSRMRKEYGLAQVNLGEVDPASETIKLATLGMRGLAVNVLWNQANHYKKVEDWTNLAATLEQLAKLQPNYIIFWKFQGWNLSYNVSVEFDDYRDRYYWVRRGVEFLQKGERYNIDHPQLLWDLGWFIGQKIGRADERRQYRRLFKEDDQFHPPDRSLEDRDNWLVGKEWYLRAIDAVDNKGHSLGRKSPRDFYSGPAKSTMNYAEAIEEDGAFEKARRAWIKAADEWRAFGNLVLEHSTGVELQLGQEPRVEKELNDLRAKLDAILPGTREKLVIEKRDKLTPEKRALLDMPDDQVPADKSEARYHAQNEILVSDREVAERIALDKPDEAKEALQLASRVDRQQTLLNFTRNYKRDANYDYWMTRAEFEQTSNALEARRMMLEARKAFEEADLVKARKLYQEGFRRWRLVIDEFPTLLDEEAMTGEDILDFIKKYREVLDQLDETIGEDFPLWEVIEKFDREQYFVEELAEHKKQQAGGPPPATAPTTTPPATTPEAAPATEATPPAETPAETPEATPPATPESTSPAAPEATPSGAPESAPPSE
jgi:hypothetical protein